ncbi:MAG: hypothetical protein U5Q03_14820 [Bacteroidota bacterium]|nr:hypothetical protein [Bacteroidota bacterium]
MQKLKERTEKIINNKQSGSTEILEQLFKDFRISELFKFEID